MQMMSPWIHFLSSLLFLLVFSHSSPVHEKKIRLRKSCKNAISSLSLYATPKEQVFVVEKNICQHSFYSFSLSISSSLKWNSFYSVKSWDWLILKRSAAYFNVGTVGKRTKRKIVYSLFRLSSRHWLISRWKDEAELLKSRK